MSFLKKLFGGGANDNPAAAAFETVDYNGFALTPAPMAEGGQFRLAGTVAKDGRSHTLIRADVFGDAETAAKFFITKAKMVVDQQGEGLFG